MNIEQSRDAPSKSPSPGHPERWFDRSIAAEDGPFVDRRPSNLVPSDGVSLAPTDSMLVSDRRCSAGCKSPGPPSRTHGGSRGGFRLGWRASFRNGPSPVAGGDRRRFGVTTWIRPGAASRERAWLGRM